MAKFFIEVDVDESFIKDSDKSAGQYLSEEMGWVVQSGIHVNDCVRIDDAKEIHLSDVVNEEYVVSEPDFAEPHDYTQTFVNMLDMCDLKLKATDNGYILADAYTGENILEDDGDVRTAEEVINIVDEWNYIDTHILNKIDLDHYGYFPEKSPFTWTTEEWVECMDDIPEIKEDFMQEYEILSMMDDTNKTVDLDYVAAEYNDREQETHKTKSVEEVER